MKPLHLLRYLIGVVVSVSCLLSACNRDIPEWPTGELRNMTFKLSGFDAAVSPLSGPQATARLALDASGRGMQALRNIEPGLEPQYLYYWSFNDETLEPHIAVDEAGAGITVDVEAGFTAGFSYDTVGAGSALRLEGAQVLDIDLPMRAIKSLTTFDFDISSSNTGPKDFSLSYSMDNGETYKELSAENQFEKMGTQSRNTFSFDLQDSLRFIGVDLLKLKFKFLPGERPARDSTGVYEYSLSSGVVKLDNIRLSGVYNAEVGTGDPTAPSTLHYYIFSSEDGSVVQQQALAMETLGEDGTLDIKLTEGSYDVLFLAYRSDKGILLPEDLTNANAFYFGQHFDDYRAVTYSVLLEDVEVGESDAEVAATLSRCYSLVEFDFTDLAADLQRVKKIEITRGHDSYLYTPFGTPTDLPMSDIQTITFTDFDNVEDYRIALHQFLGLSEGVRNVSYELTAYGEGGTALNTVTISQSIRNNVRLRLRGRLLGDTGAINGFSIALDTEWGELLDHEF